MKGSTFSYLISRYAKDKIITIDLDNINNKEELLLAT